MADQNRRLVMDIVAPAAVTEPPAKNKRSWAHTKRLFHIPPAYRRTFYILGAFVVLAVVTFLANHYQHKHMSRIANSSAFPSSELHQITGFKFYYLRPEFRTDFVLDRGNISVQPGILVFEMKNSVGKSLVFTEEATPPNYDPSSLQVTKQYNNEFGRAFITDESSRTTGVLLTQDGTWVLINAPKPVGADLMKQLLDALVPNGA